MRFRKLRIGWSVVCGIACVLLVVLWVRSYTWTDLVNLWPNRGIASGHGAIDVAPSATSQRLVSLKGMVEEVTLPEHSTLGFGYSPALPRIRVPYWFPIVLSLAIGALPWIRWRFSLRTLLIATTLVAVVLGLVVRLGR